MNKKILITLVILIIAVLVAIYMYKDNEKTSMTNTTATPTATVDDNRIAEVGDLLVVNYTGTLENGTKFDSSYDRGEPIAFLLGKNMVIKGWDEGLIGVKKGDKKHLVITADKAYGAEEKKDAAGKVIIPKNSTLVFDIEVVEVISAQRVDEMMKQQQAAQAVEASMTEGPATN